MKKVLWTIASTLARRGLLLAGSALAAHGVIGTSGVQEFVEAGLGVLTVAASLGHDVWVNYGHDIVRNELAALKARSEARLAATKTAAPAASTQAVRP